jgi:hypothetical protein
MKLVCFRVSFKFLLVSSLFSKNLIIPKNNEMPNQARYKNNIFLKHSWLVHFRPWVKHNYKGGLPWWKKTKNPNFLKLQINIINIQLSRNLKSKLEQFQVDVASRRTHSRRWRYQLRCWFTLAPQFVTMGMVLLFTTILSIGYFLLCFFMWPPPFLFLIAFLLTGRNGKNQGWFFLCIFRMLPGPNFAVIANCSFGDVEAPVQPLLGLPHFWSYSFQTL